MSLSRSSYLANVSPTGYDLVRTPYKLSAVMSPILLTQNRSLENGALLVDFSHVSSIVVNMEMNFTSSIALRYLVRHPQISPSYR
jgi:hypothetical protein